MCVSKKQTRKLCVELSYPPGQNNYITYLYCFRINDGHYVTERNVFIISIFGYMTFGSSRMFKNCVELRFPVTTEMFENPVDDRLASAASEARARVEVNI